VIIFNKEAQTIILVCLIKNSSPLYQEMADTSSEFPRNSPLSE